MTIHAVLGDALIDLAKGADRELVLCAPFAKVRVITDVLDATADGVGIVLYTRWRPDEVAAGVSDTDVLDLVEARGGTVMLHDRLHAKFFRTESCVLLGSANLTAAALGWSRQPNLELLVRGSRDDVSALESLLQRDAMRATRALAEQVEALAALMPSGPREEPQSTSLDPSDSVWMPSLRHPENLYVLYSGEFESATAQAAIDGARDLEVLDLPPGLTHLQFEQLVGYRMLQQPFFRAMDEFLLQSRRFGELRAFVQSYNESGADQAEAATQTISRWLREFHPQRYRSFTPNRTEVIQRVESGPTDE